MTATLDYYEDSDDAFTFNSVSTVSSEIQKSYDVSDDFKSTWRDDDQLEDRLSDENAPSICPKNKCFIGFSVGIPLSILIWTGIFLLLI